MVPAAPTSASTSASTRKVQWSTLAAPSSTASRTPGRAASWLPCTRRPSPASRAARSTRRASASVKAWGLAGSQKTSAQRARARTPRASGRDQVEVGRAVAARLRRYDVGAEEGRLVGDLAGQPQRALLVVDVEPVAALDLDGRRAERAHLGDAGARSRAELVVARRPGRRDGDPDAAAVVGDARHPGAELGRPVARVDEVAVAVDEAGHHGAAAEVDAAVGRGGVDGPPDPDDPVVGHDRRRPRRCRAARRRWSGRRRESPSVRRR